MYGPDANAGTGERAMTRTPKTSRNTDAALGAFIAKKAEIDAMLERLRDLSEDHFDVTPDEVNWGHVGTLSDYAELLKRITDAAFKEGEYAA
jgi:hypothetical protein